MDAGKRAHTRQSLCLTIRRRQVALAIVRLATQSKQRGDSASGKLGRSKFGANAVSFFAHTTLRKTIQDHVAATLWLDFGPAQSVLFSRTPPPSILSRLRPTFVYAVLVAASACSQGSALDNSVDSHADSSLPNTSVDTESSSTTPSHTTNSHSTNPSDPTLSDSTSTADASCRDNVQNQDESDVDCGGVVCGPCAVDKNCDDSSDCVSNSCVEERCAKPSCTDKVKNGDESDVDCGAACPTLCEVDGHCQSAADCQSERCENGQCAAPECTDKVKNGDESDVDCGGSCPDCLPGDSCNQGSDCIADTCTDHVCDDVACVNDDDCDDLDGPCTQGNCLANHTCEAKAVRQDESCDSGTPCLRQETCNDGVCQGGAALDCSSLTSICATGRCEPSLDNCVADPVVYFREDFYLASETLEDKGWIAQAGSDWDAKALQGSAVNCGSQGSDPSQDHTAGTSDNFVLGTRVNACVEAIAHGYECVTSPRIDLPPGTSAVDLSLWSHRHTLAKNQGFYHAISLFNHSNSTYEERFSGFDGALNATIWTQEVYEINAPYAASYLRFSLCFARTVSGIEVAGDNFDDITVVPRGCALP